MDTNDMEEAVSSLSTARLELAYDNVVSNTKAIINEEQSRVLRMRVLLTEDDQTTLCARLEEATKHLERAADTEADVRKQLKQSQDDLIHTEDLFRSSLREVDNLKSQLNSLHNMFVDSNKLLADKSVLVREASNMRQEIEQLRSSESSYQALASEKLALERQLSSLELELENEKRALARTRVKEQNEGEVDAVYKIQLEKINKELMKERRDREEVEKNARAEAKEWARQRTLLETKLNESKVKTSEAKSRTESVSNRQVLHNVSSLDGEREVDKSRKRNAANFKSDLTIATPGAVNVSKKAQRLSSMPGHKSTFSITPFINRVSAASPSSDSEQEIVDGRQSDKQKRIEEVTTSDDKSGLGNQRPVGFHTERVPTASSLNKPSSPKKKIGKQFESENSLAEQSKTNLKSSISTAQRGIGKRQRVLGKRNNKPLF